MNSKNDQNSNDKKKENFESETHENSTQENSENRKNKKFSVDFFPKKMEIEEIEDDIGKRRNTIAMCKQIKNFVPQIKPIKVDFVPSKLRLNKMGFKDLKCNKNNKVLLYANKYFISCPNIQEEEVNDEIDNIKAIDKINVNLSNEINNNNNINQTRKKMLIIKNENIPKVLSENNPHSKNKYNKELNIGNSSELDLYDIGESLNDSINEDEFQINILNNDNNFDKDNNNNNKRERYNSWSILDILQKKNKLE